MAISFRHLTLALLLCALRLDLPAQADPTPVRTTFVRFYYHSLTGSDSNSNRGEPRLKGNLEIKKNKTVYLNIEANGSSQNLTYSGDGPLIIYETNKTEQGSVRKVIATIPLPPGLKSVLYFVVYEGGSYQFKPLPFSADGVPANHVKILNLCPVSLAAQFSSSQGIVPAQGEAYMDISKTGKIMEIKIARQIGDQWKMDVDVVLLAPNPEERLFFLLLPDSLAFNRVTMMPMGPMPAALTP